MLMSSANWCNYQSTDRLTDGRDRYVSIDQFYIVIDADAVLGDKVREFLASLQYFRIFIGLWNFVIILAMFT